jgi:hypothetical protein
MKNDKSINRAALPARNEPSGFQPPHKPGYDVIDARGPGEIRQVGDMSDTAYPGRIGGITMGADLSPEATNCLGGFGKATQSDAADEMSFQHPALADKPTGSPQTNDVPGVRIKGTGSDDPFDRFPDRQRSNAAPDADD